jgi:hypothetical protein
MEVERSGSSRRVLALFFRVVAARRCRLLLIILLSRAVAVAVQVKTLKFVVVAVVQAVCVAQLRQPVAVAL